MRVLFLGNSFTYCHDLPEMAGKLLSWETASVTRGGAYLHDFLNPEDELSVKMQEALDQGPWDFVIIQEQSFNAVGDADDYLQAAGRLCQIIRAREAQPVIYASWAYREGSEKMKSKGISYQEMDDRLARSFAKAAAGNHALLAPVGHAFTALRNQYPLYSPEDDYHPTIHGSYIAACVLCRAMAPHLALQPWHPEGISPEDARSIQKGGVEAC